MNMLCGGSGNPVNLAERGLVDMQDELAALLRRKVDLVTRGGLRNPYRRHEILTTRRVVYEA